MTSSQKKPSEILDRMRSVTLRERGEEGSAPAATEAEPAAATPPLAPVTRPPRQTQEPGGTPAATPPPRTRPAGDKPVRYTLDLSREQHRFLKQFALDQEVDASEVMRLLLRQLEQDTGLAQRLQAKLG